jgi:hypothetical protein
MAERDRTDTEVKLRVLVTKRSRCVGSILAVVQSIARQECERSCFSRIDAFARTQRLLMQSEWRGALVGDILHAELLPFKANGPQWSLHSSDVILKPEHGPNARADGAANDARNGALSVPGRHVSVTWNGRALMTTSGRDSTGAKKETQSWRRTGLKVSAVGLSGERRAT